MTQSAQASSSSFATSGASSSSSSSVASGSSHSSSPQTGFGPNPKVRAWIDDCVKLLKPDQIVWCDGSKQERERFFEQGVKEKVFVKLNAQKWPGCYYHRSNSND